MKAKNFCPGCQQLLSVHDSVVKSAMCLFEFHKRAGGREFAVKAVKLGMGFDIPKETESEKFEAEFNFCMLIGTRIKRIEFMDGSTARYGFEWMD